MTPIDLIRRREVMNAYLSSQRSRVPSLPFLLQDQSSQQSGTLLKSSSSSRRRRIRLCKKSSPKTSSSLGDVQSKKREYSTYLRAFNLTFFIQRPYHCRHAQNLSSLDKRQPRDRRQRAARAGVLTLGSNPDRTSGLPALALNYIHLSSSLSIWNKENAKSGLDH